MNWKPTNAQQLLLNAFLSIVLAALAAAGTGFVTVMQTGNVNFLGCFSAALVAFWGVFGPSLYVYVPAHVTQEVQALQDTQAQLQESHNAALQALNNAFGTIRQLQAPTPATSAPASPLVVIHAQNATPANAAPAQESASPTPSPLVQPTPTYLANNASGSTVAVPSTDLLADLPQPNGVPTTPMQITGRIPTYGQSAQ